MDFQYKNREVSISRFKYHISMLLAGIQFLKYFGCQLKAYWDDLALNYLIKNKAAFLLSIIKLQKKILIFFILIASLFMQGCMNVAVTGAQVIYDRNNLQKSFTDYWITMEAYQKLFVRNKNLKKEHITVSTLHCEVLLTGQVSRASQKVEAENIVRNICNVKKVYNLLEICRPVSSLVKMSDSWLTTKIKSKLIACNDIDPTKIKVVTENGTVYLMGIVPPNEADIAVDIARTTDGVQRVVKLFYYMRISRN